MKNIKQLLMPLTCLAFLNVSGANPKEIKAPMASVKVFLNAALISHSHKTTLSPGENRLIFTGLAMNINNRSIRLYLSGNAELRSLWMYRINDATPVSQLQEDLHGIIKKQKDSLLLLEKEMEKTYHEIQGLLLEKGMLLNNGEWLGSGRQMAPNDLKVATDFFRNRYRELGLELALKEKSLEKLREQKIKLFKTAFGVESTGENQIDICIILADIKNEGPPIDTEMELSYLAKESGWFPVYEIHSGKGKGQNLSMKYKAKVLNNTGIDWNNMAISLSTADPFQYYAAPDLEPIRITRYRKPPPVQATAATPDIKKDPQSAVEEIEIMAPDWEINFQLDKKYTFKSGMKSYMVNVTEYALEPEFLYRCAAKKEEKVYSIARIRDWEKLNLLEGEASIFSNGSYLGKAYIRPNDLDEYLEIPLGVVKNIFVRHRLVSEFSGKKTLSSGEVATYTYEIKVKNNSNEKAIIEIMDQVPVSEESSIKIDVVEMTDGGEKDALTGKIVWKTELKPGAEKVVRLKYSGNYPKGYIITGKYKTAMRNARFI